MKVVICPDSFKESMSSIEAADAIERGVLKADKNIKTVKIPLADGGEGTSTVLNEIYKGRKVTLKAHDAYMRLRDTYYYRKDNTAIIELAAVCGLEMIEKDLRHPLYSSSYGFGEVIMHAINSGCDNILLGLGGSACNDGGIGMLSAMGTRFYDSKHNELSAMIANIDMIDSYKLKKYPDIKFKAACDVKNPYTGKQGATYVFGPQKGADKQELDILENKLKHLDSLFHLSEIESTGAAGGTSGALYLLGTKLISGIELILSESGIEKELMDADLCISGEGSIDAQSSNGKTISGIAALCKKHDIPLICFGGRTDKNLDSLYCAGVSAVFSICDRPKSLEEALKEGPFYLEDTVYNVMRLIKNF